MRYTYLGGSGIQVSELCLGTMNFGNEADELESHRLMDIALDAGINFYDTADVYCGGETERIVGKWIKNKRSDIILGTKTNFPSGTGINNRGNSRHHILLGVEESLKRLQTDYIDILYLHHWDSQTDIEQTLSATNQLVEQGKVHYIAVSNFSAWQCLKASMTCSKHQLAPIVAMQPMYSLIKRIAEVEIFPMATSENIAVCPYSPMGSGMLTGKYHRNEKGRITVNPMYKERYKNPEYMDVSGRFVEYAHQHDLNPAALSIAWAASHPAVTSPIIGIWNAEQLQTALDSQEIDLDLEQRATISALGVEPPDATDRESVDHLKVTSKDDR